ncbi:MAG TPA: hypothetical protein VHT34_10365, partial [Clostridia bacterium]|nr:hypothetical protein [Clostridia bacterium]
MKRLLKTISKVVILAFITTNLIIPYNAANAESTSIASQIVNYSGNSKKEILVKFKDAGKSESIKKGLKKKLKLSKLDLKKKSRHRGIELLEIDNTDDMNKVLGELNSNSEVEYAQPNYLLSLLTVDNTATPASISVQSNVNTIINQQNPNISTSSGITIEKDKEKDMKKKDKKDKGSDVVVGIIDTGIDINNLELKDSIYQNIKEIPG